MVYPNLEVEMVRNKLTRKDVANVLKINTCTVTPKLNDVTRMKFHEALAIKNELFPNLDLNYLFATENNFNET